VIPGAHRVNRLRPERKFTRMARLSSEVGWKYGQVVERLEAKRKVRAEAYHLRKRALERLQAKAKATAEGALKEEAKTLAQFGY
jgi:large subunit ribosomal protein L13Ae